MSMRSELFQQDNQREDYLDAQRAAAEAVQIGRETLEETSRQGEQLEHANRLADQTRYAIDKSARLLKGMTWSGWMSNLMTKDVAAPPKKDETTTAFSYDHAPAWASPAAQSIQNYKANLMVLEACETRDQLATCQLVCENMYSAASNLLAGLEVPTEQDRPLMQRMMNDLTRFRQQQRAVMKRKQQQQQQQQQQASTSNATTAAGKKTVSAPRTPTMEDQHLDIIAHSLDELNSTALSLNEMMNRQNNLMQSLDDKADDNYERSKMVSRRADRLTHKKTWAFTKKEFDRCVTIRHVPSGYYFASAKGNVMLTKEFRPDTCIYEVWKRKSGLFGLKNKYTSRWVGQSLLGNLGCSSTSFGAREEWQTGEDLTATRLLCASAGWGNGGYLFVRKSDSAILIGTLGDKDTADLWRVDDYESQLD